jgi:site-specific DNA recombinase
LIEVTLTLLEEPQALYRRCNDDQKRLLNQAIFHRLYVDEDEVTGYELNQPFAALHAVHTGQTTPGRTRGRPAPELPQTPKWPPPITGNGHLRRTIVFGSY